jgi:LacI family transcriptional regulator
MRVTMEDIAKACGVSRPTVTLILSGRGDDYAAKTRERVIRAARSLGYRRNTSARAIQTGRFDAVALLLGNKAELGMMASGLLTKIEALAMQRGYHLAIGHLPGEVREDREMPRLLTESLVDGMIVHVDRQLNRGVREMIAGLRSCPCVWVGEPVKSNGVWADERGAARGLVGYLAGLGHRRIAYAGPVEWSVFEAEERRGGYLAGMRLKGLRAELRDVPVPWLPMAQMLAHAERARGQVGDWLSGRERPTAVVAYSKDQAMLVLLVALQMGLRVPGDLSIVTFGDFVVNVAAMPVTGMYVKTSRMGEAAFEMLLRRIESEGGDEGASVIEYELTVGQTTGEPG